VGLDTALDLVRDPVADRLTLLAFARERADRRRRAIEHGNGIAPGLGVAVDVRYRGAE